MNKVNVLLAVLLSVGQLTIAAEMGIPLQLKLKSPLGTYPTENGISVRVQVLSAGTDCILREENFSGQSIKAGALNLVLGSGTRGVNDPNLTLNQIYDNSKSKTGLSCVDANGNIISVSQTYNPTSIDKRTVRITTVVNSENILVNFSMRSTPYAIQAESVGGKVASEIVVNDITTQMNQTNLNDLLFDLTRFNNLKNLAVSGQVNSSLTANSAVNFSGSLAGDVSGTQGATSVDKIKGYPVSSSVPTTGQVLQFNGTQYVASSLPAAPVISVAGKTGAVVLSSSDISGLSFGTLAGTFAQGNDSRIAGALQNSSSASGDVTGTFSNLVVQSIDGKSKEIVSQAIDDVNLASSASTANLLVRRDASGNASFGVVSANSASVQNLYVFDISNTNNIRIKTPASFSNYVLTLPVDDGAVGQFLQTDGSGNLSWVSQSASPVTSVAGRTGAVVLSSSDISGLGNAAALNVGTAAGTVAEGNDSRIVGALQSSAFNGYVASANCTSSQSMYWNSVSSQFLCQSISFPAESVSSVAGRTGTIVLSSADISGLGNSASLNVGTAAGTVAAGNDSRFTDSRSPNGSASGDLSGNYPNPTVAKIQGRDVSATAPTSGYVLKWNGSSWAPSLDNSGSGTVTSVSASSPLSSSGGASPNITLSKASGSVDGYLASTDFVVFNSKLSNTLNSGLIWVGNGANVASAVSLSGDAAINNSGVLTLANSGVVAGTYTKVTVNAKGLVTSSSSLNSNDVTTALGYVPSNSVGAVTSVAGRTGAVVLSSSDISGLSFGAVAGTFAQGNDSRFTDSRSPIGSASGDLSGSYPNPSVVKIQGRDVAATAPTSGYVLKWNGTSWSPSADNSGGGVASVTASAPLSSSGGLNPNITISVGTAAGTVAAGNDSRITGALQSTVFNGYVASANCTSSQSMYWNSVSSQFLCQSISFPAESVNSVAGRTGAIVLSSADISGLGNSAGLNVGTASNTVAAGNDSRIVNAVQNSTTASGDVSGTFTTLSVDKIKGRTISSTAPVAGQALIYNGTDWVPTYGVASYFRKPANQAFTSTTAAAATSLAFNVVSGSVYKYKFNVIYTSAATGTGLKLGLTYPAVTSASAKAYIPISNTDGIDAVFLGIINSSGDVMTATNTPAAAPVVHYAVIEGVTVPSANGTVQLIVGSEVNLSTITVLAGSFVEVTLIP